MTKRTLSAALVALALAAAAYAQGPLQQKVHYTINVPHEIQFGGYLLPPGRYELYQVNVTDLNLFGLYRENNSHSPLALIRTTRRDFTTTNEPPGETTIRLEYDEDSSAARPVLRGWTVPGEDGWEIIAVDGKDEKLVRIK